MHFFKQALTKVFPVVAAIVLFSCHAFSDEITMPSADRLPRGDWSYDALAKLASQGLVPNTPARTFEGDRLLNRLEVARIMESVVDSDSAKDLDGFQAMLIGRLVREFRPEISLESPNTLTRWNSREDALKKPSAVVVGTVSAIASANPKANEHSSISVAGVANLSEDVFAAAALASRRQQYFLQDTGVNQPSKAFISGYNRIADWTVGREPISWGPSYLGSLLVSDNSAPFYQLRGTTQIDFGSIIGKFRITQFVTKYTETGKDLYLLGRRYEKPIFGRRWHLGIGETLETNKSPNPVMFVMPFYFYENCIASKSFDSECNVICSADLLYEARNGNQYYGEFAVDDISAPKALFPNRFRRPRKTGATLGFYTPKLLKGDKLSTFRAEYTYVDPQTYEATRSDVPELDYRQNGDLIGSPIGPNSVAIYLRSEQYLSAKFSLITEYLDQHKRNKTSLTPTEERRYISLMAAYDLSPGRSISFRVAPYRLSPIGQEARTSVFYEIRGMCTF